MNKIITKIIFSVIFLIFVIGNTFGQNQEDPKYKINPTRDKNSSTGLYIPENLEDCFKELDKMLHPEIVKEMRSGTENDMINYHFGLGMWLRNNWGLWSESRLAKYFNDFGVYHSDNISGIILDSYWRYLNDKPIKFDEQIKYYKEWDRVHQRAPEDSFPKTKGELTIKGGTDYTTSNKKPGHIHVYQDKTSGDLWLFEQDKGWYKPDKEFIDNWKNK